MLAACADPAPAVMQPGRAAIREGIVDELDVESLRERLSELDSLRSRVKELEDAVLYLSNTLAMHGLIDSTEAGVARRMYDSAQQAEREAGRRR
jgi:hypothetical protein